MTEESQTIIDQIIPEHRHEVREYKKAGGTEQLNKDFDKMPGEKFKTKDGTETKIPPDGTTIVKGTKNKHGPTLEIQPSKNDPRYADPGIRIKVRYL